MRYKVYQSSTAQQDHENDECLKVVVLYDGEASFPAIKPDLSFALGCVYIQTRTAIVTLCNRNPYSSNIIVFMGLNGQQMYDVYTLLLPAVSEIISVHLLCTSQLKNNPVCLIITVHTLLVSTLKLLGSSKMYGPKMTEHHQKNRSPKVTHGRSFKKLFR